MGEAWVTHPHAPSRWGPLSEPAFRLLWTGQTVSALGDRITPIALAFAVLGLGGSASDIGVVMLAQTLPLAVFLLVGGVWADRLDRRRVMLACDVVRMVGQGVLAGLLLSGRPPLWQVAVCAAVLGTAQAFFEPAATGLVPRVVSAGRLGQANALSALSLNVAMIVGPIAAGLLIAAVSPGAAIAVDAGTFLVSALFLARLRPVAVAPAPAAERRPFARDLADGLREVTGRGWLRAGIGAFTVYHALVLPAIFVLGPVAAERRYHGASGWGWLTAAFGVGAVVGSLVALRLRPARPILLTSLLLVGGALQPLEIGVGLPLAAVAGLLAVGGACISVLFVVWDTTLARTVAPAALSRVSSLDLFGSYVGTPLGVAVIGPVSVAVGLRPTMVAITVLGVAAALATAARRDVRALRADEPAAPAGSAAA